MRGVENRHNKGLQRQRWDGEINKIKGGLLAGYLGAVCIEYAAADDDVNRRPSLCYRISWSRGRGLGHSRTMDASQVLLSELSMFINSLASKLIMHYSLEICIKCK